MRIVGQKKEKTRLVSVRLSDESIDSVEREARYFDKNRSDVVRERVERHIKKEAGQLSDADIKKRCEVVEKMALLKCESLGSLLIHIKHLEEDLIIKPYLKTELNMYKREAEWKKLQPQKFDAEAAAEAAADRERLNKFMNALSQQRLKS